ncbi:MAG: alpha/beta hydrolase [Microbacteriaceae bacterium]|nr:alpha/beta hydrolase [Microbacteriaceae bacterium]MCL2795372.1 alpha/beta hydrolase [Microbacteriaceae bacterium]
MPITLPTRLGRLGVRVEEGPREAAVLWHSFFVDSHSWDRMVPVLKRLRTLVLIDGPSFGASEPLHRASTIAECALAAFEVLDTLGIDRADWVGNGWGGQVGIAAALESPRRIRSLVSIGAPVAPIAGRERCDLAISLPLVRALGFAPFIQRRALQSVLTPRTLAVDPEAVRIVRSGFAHVERRGFIQAAKSFVLDRPSLEAAAEAVEVPTVFVAGDARDGWGPADAQAMTDKMADARTRTLHGVRNIAPLEDPDAVAAIVREQWTATARR